VSYINAEWDELKVYDTVINTSCITSRKHCPLRETRRDGERNESEIAGSLVRDFWAATEYGGVPEFLNRPRNRGHRLIARWIEDILLEASSIKHPRRCKTTGWFRLIETGR